MPEILVVHLKRFVKHPKRSVWNKLNVNVEIRMQQQIESMQGKVDYELVSICNHYGEIDSGHYIGVCKRGSEWIIRDDEQYSQTENLHVFATKADFLWICNVSPQMLGQLGVCFPELALDALERTIEFHKAMNNSLFFLFGEHLCSAMLLRSFED
jgi:hypothetical protein